MAVRIRLRRAGSSKNPIWRIVVADKRSPRDGRTIETIGSYNPQTEPSEVRIDTERAQHWIDHGAQPSRRWRSSCARRKPIPPRTSLLGLPMRELVEFLVRALVEKPDEVEVEEFEEDGDLVLEVTVAEDDLGRVIGRGGRIANAIRTVARAAGSRGDRRVVVDILD